MSIPIVSLLLIDSTEGQNFTPFLTQHYYISIMSDTQLEETDFPLQAFLAALRQESGSFSDKLFNYTAEVEKKNMSWTHAVIAAIFEVFRNQEQMPLTKYHAMLTVQALLDTCEYTALTLIEVYILPFCQATAALALKKGSNSSWDYFIEAGYPKSLPNIQKLSKNFIQLTSQFIIQAAAIKPKRTCENQELLQHSNFHNALLALDQKFVANIKPQFYKSQPAENRKKYLKKLKQFNKECDKFAEYFLGNMLPEVETGQKEMVELKLLLPFGDAYLTSGMISLCEEELDSMTERIEVKKRYLNLLNELARWGDIEAIIMIHHSEFLSSITANICNVQGQLGLQHGENIYPEILGKKSDKKEFYVDFLRSIETWATCLPRDYQNEEFSLQKIYEFLKIEKKFKFPQNLHLQRFEKEMKENLKRNEQRNEKLISLLQNGESSKYTSLERSKSKFSKTNNILGKTKLELISVEDMEDKVKDAAYLIKQLCKDQGKLEERMKQLAFFKENWINYLDNLNIDEKVEEAKLEVAIAEGDKCVEHIQFISPIYLAYSKHKINLDQFYHRITEGLAFHQDISLCKSITKQMSNSISMRKSNLSRSGIDRIKKSKLDKSKSIFLKQQVQQSKKEEDSKQHPIKQDSKQTKRFTNELHKISSLNSVMPSFADQDQIDKKKSSLTLKKKENELSEEPKLSKPQAFQIQYEPTEIQKITRIPEYQNNFGENAKPISRLKRNSDSQNSSRSSRLLVKKSEIIEKLDEDELRSQQQRRSQSRSKPVVKKQTSIFKKNSSRSLSKQASCESIKNQLHHEAIELERTKKTILVEPQASEINKTLEMKEEKQNNNKNYHENNNNRNKSSILSENNNPRILINHQYVVNENQFAGVSQISSIHESDKLRVFNNSAQRILNNSNEHDESNTSHDLKLKGRGEKMSSKFANAFVGDYQVEHEIGLTSRIQTVKNRKHLKLSSILQAGEELLISPTPKISHQKSTGLLPNYNQEPRFQAAFTNDDSGMTPTQRHQMISKNQDNFQNVIKLSHKSQSRSKPSINFQKQENLKNETYFEEQKNKQIEELHQKIKSLEKETYLMKQKLAAKDQELKSIKNSSQKGFAQFTTPSQSNYDLSEHFGNKSERGSSQKNWRKSNDGKDNFKNTIQNKMKQYMEKIKGNTFRKSLLKLKCLVHKTDEIEIGCMSLNGQNCLNVTLYITAHRQDMVDFTISLLHDEGLSAKIFPSEMALIPCKKQQKVHVSWTIQAIPFCIPELEINYKSNTEYSTNYLRLAFPLSFNKFCQFHQVGLKLHSDLLQGEMISTDEFRLNAKVVKVEKLSESFPNFGNIQSEKQSIGNSILSSLVSFHQNQAYMTFRFSEKSCRIQINMLKGERRVMEFLLCTFKQILEDKK